MTTSPHPTTVSPTPRTTSPAPRQQQEAKGQADGLTLDVTAGGTPQAGKFFEDLGYFAIRGVVSDQKAGTTVGIYWYDTKAKQWHKSGVAITAAKGAYAFNQPVGYAGPFAFRTTLGGAPGASGVTSSNQVSVTVADSYVKEYQPVASIDSLKNPVVSGYVYPGRKGVTVQIQVLRSDKRYHTSVNATSDATGRFRATLAYGNGTLASYRVRSAYTAVNRSRLETSTAYAIKRVKVLNAVVTSTTSAQVAKTYRAGCPVGPSKLRTISMNYLGFDGHMHRGVLIVRSSLTGKITRGFTKALSAGYPIWRMQNPNDYGGNDPKQMAADNTSGFNCRKVVGNPYAQSPHSYGIAIDVNTVQNPYRDRNGTWWPKNGRSYIDRTPRRTGMLTYHSNLTTQLRHEGYFWGGLWSPGKDYQHFEYDK